MRESVKVVPKDPEGKLPPTEVIAEAILEIAEGFKKIRSGRLTDRAMLVLVHDAVRGRVGKPAIQEVLSVLSELDLIYLKRKGGANAGG